MIKKRIRLLAFLFIIPFNISLFGSSARPTESLEAQTDTEFRYYQIAAKHDPTTTYAQSLDDLQSNYDRNFLNYLLKKPTMDEKTFKIIKYVIDTYDPNVNSKDNGNAYLPLDIVENHIRNRNQSEPSLSYYQQLNTLLESKDARHNQNWYKNINQSSEQQAQQQQTYQQQSPQRMTQQQAQQEDYMNMTLGKVKSGLNATNNTTGNTWLHEAVEENNNNAIIYLLLLGADTKITNNAAKTAYDILLSETSEDEKKTDNFTTKTILLKNNNPNKFAKFSPQLTAETVTKIRSEFHRLANSKPEMTIEQFSKHIPTLIDLSDATDPSHAVDILLSILDEVSDNVRAQSSSYASKAITYGYYYDEEDDDNDSMTPQDESEDEEDEDSYEYLDDSDYAIESKLEFVNDINDPLPNNNGNTLLHEFAATKNLKGVNRLITKYNARTDVKNNDNETPYEYFDKIIREEEDESGTPKIDNEVLLILDILSKNQQITQLLDLLNTVKDAVLDYSSVSITELVKMRDEALKFRNNDKEVNRLNNAILSQNPSFAKSNPSFAESNRSDDGYEADDEE